MEEADLILLDPFIGFLVAIGASIHLEHTLGVNAAITGPANHKFRKCVNFVSRLAEVWPNLRHTVSFPNITNPATTDPALILCSSTSFSNLKPVCRAEEACNMYRKISMALSPKQVLVKSALARAISH
jgi:hypothetical protein